MSLRNRWWPATDCSGSGSVETVIKAPTRAKAFKKMRRIQIRGLQAIQSDPELRMPPEEAKKYFWAMIGDKPTLSPWRTTRTRSGGYGC